MASPYIFIRSAQLPKIYLCNVPDLNMLVFSMRRDECLINLHPHIENWVCNAGKRQKFSLIRKQSRHLTPLGLDHLEEHVARMSRHAPELIYRNGDGFFDFGVLQLIILPIPFLFHLY